MAYVLTDSEIKRFEELETGRLGVLQKGGNTAMSNTSRILVIGLGGMGLNTVSALKQALHERVGKIDGQSIQFLCLDTSRNDTSNHISSGDLRPTEVPSLDNSRLKGIMAMNEQYRPAWINNICPVGFNPPLNDDGAGQNRLAGRLALMNQDLFTPLTDAIRSTIRELRDFATLKLDVHVIAGLGGGTGSGLVIDIPYLIRHIATQDLSIYPNQIKFYGHIYLPNVYKNSPTDIKSANRNGYAALKEIDYYMNIEDHRGAYSAQYPGMSVSSGNNIFDYCTLIGGEIPSITQSDPKTFAVTKCVDNLINLTTLVEGNIEKGKTGSISDFFSSGSFLSNIVNATNVTLSDRTMNRFSPYGNYCYQFIGSSVIKFPTEAIVNQYLGKVFGTMMRKLADNANLVTDDKVAEFEKLPLKPATMLKVVSTEIEDKLRSALDDQNIDKNTASGNVADAVLEQIVLNAVARFGNGEDILNKALKDAETRAAEIFKDSQRGPLYLARLLTCASQLEGYFARLADYPAQIIKLIDANKEERTTLMTQRQETIKKLQGMMVFGKARLLEEYKDETVSLFMNRFQGRILEIMANSMFLRMDTERGVLFRMKDHLCQQILNSVDVLTSIYSVIQKNEKVAQQIMADTQDDSSILSRLEPEFVPLRSAAVNAADSAFARLGEEGVDNFTKELLAHMMNDRKQWQVPRENDSEFTTLPCADAFRDFVNNYVPFRGIMKNNLYGYLSEAYKGKTSVEKDRVAQKLLSIISTSAVPTCLPWDNGFNWGQVEKLHYSYLTIPEGPKTTDTVNDGKDDDWRKIFEGNFGIDSITRQRNIYTSKDENAIYCYNLYANMPIWLSKDIKEYETDYLAMLPTSPGLHIDEGKDRKPEYKDYPPLFLPDQWYRAETGIMSYTNGRETKYREELFALFDKAVAAHIITKDSTGTYGVNTFERLPGAAEVATFAKNYIEDMSNRDTNDELIVEPRYFDSFAQTYSAVWKPIVTQCGWVDKADETVAKELLRKQMILNQSLRDMMAYYESVMLPPLSVVIDGYETKRNIRRVVKYMMYNLIINDRGSWFYVLGDQRYKIMSLDVIINSNKPWQKNYQEMPLVDNFCKMERLKAHGALLDDRVKVANTAIYNDNPNLLNELRVTYDTNLDRARKILDDLREKELMGRTLSAMEQEIKEFYTLFEAALIDQWSFD